MYLKVNSAHYVKMFLITLWNMIVFFCPLISQSNAVEHKKLFFSLFVSNFDFLNIIYKNIKEFIKIKVSKQRKNNTVSKCTYNNNYYYYYALNRINIFNTAINCTLKGVNLLYTKGLKAVLAAQNLISKKHYIRIQDKCAFLYPHLL